MRLQGRKQRGGPFEWEKFRLSFVRDSPSSRQIMNRRGSFSPHPERAVADLQPIGEHLAQESDYVNSRTCPVFSCGRCGKRSFSLASSLCQKSEKQAETRPRLSPTLRMPSIGRGPSPQPALPRQEHTLRRYALEFVRATTSLIDVKGKRPRDLTSEERWASLPVAMWLAREWQLVQLAELGACAHSSLARHEEREDGDLADAGRRNREELRATQGTGTIELSDTHVLAPQNQQVIDFSKDGLQSKHISM